MPTHGRDPADAWVTAPDGQRYWGLNGAAGLLAHDPARGVLMQHRAGWSHHGDTWGLPGGARHLGEGAREGALREAREEAAVPASCLHLYATHLLDLGVWTYTTVIAEVVERFEPLVADAESLALAWVPVDEVGSLDLHPGVESAWPSLVPLLAARPVLVVDLANLMGSRPDGWWRDRLGAATRLVADLGALGEAGIPGSDLGLAAHQVMPRIVAVTEGEARGVASRDHVDVVDAERDGDAAVVAEAERLAAAGFQVTVCTSDRGLVERLPQGTASRGSGWLRGLLDG